MQKPRSAGALGVEFPYTLATMCYLEVAKDGTVTWGRDAGSYERAVSGQSTLYAVWPGQWSSNLFIIDDLDRYAGGMGIKHDEELTGLADHRHELQWSVSRYETKPQASYVTVDVQLTCGCSIKDLRAFAAQMQSQRGWQVATSGGYGAQGSDKGGYTYSLRVRRTSL
jgi:hypothetical protein